MTDTKPRRSIHGVRVLVDLAEHAGIPPAVCLEGSGIAFAELENPEAEAEWTQELTVVRNLHRHPRTPPDLPFQAGRRFRVMGLGIFGAALLTRATVADAIELAHRLEDLGGMLTRWSYQGVCGDEARTVAQVAGVPGDVRSFVVERDVVSVARAMLDYVPGRIALRRVELPFPAPDHAERLRDALGCDILFEQPETVVAMDARFLDLPLPQASRHSSGQFERQAKQILALRRSRSGTVASVREMLSRDLTEIPRMEQMARDLGMTARTLRRHLANEGSSFRNLVDEQREALAEHLLRSTRLSVEDVAERLGYAEPTAFQHAFKRWKGVSPRAYRSGRPD